MSEIRVMEKPDWISWNEIHELLLSAHKKNIAKGMVMGVPQLSGEELKNRVGDNGKCFVALFDNSLVGTTSISYFQGKHWYDKGKLVAHSLASGILPKYQGIGIYEELMGLRDADICDMHAEIIHADTAEDNKIIRMNAKRNGFVDVDFRFVHDHYSVIFVKWLNGCPFSDSYIKFRYKITKALTMLQYAPGKGEKSKIISFFCKAIRKVISIVG
ncbi:MAG: hypothetical protein IJL61_04525 [Bacteroidales bacterium]|nr:hypothetical protein [Bacteroidales bacterium]